jgi:hypothetical protein
VPSSTKDASNKGKTILFPSSPLAVEIKGKRPFIRSSMPKDIFKEQPLPEIPTKKKTGKSIKNPMEEKSETLTQRKKGKGSSQPTEGKQEAPVHKGKDKGNKRPLESKYETSEKSIEKPIERKDETPVLRKKNKSKVIKEPDEIDKTLPMQEEEESEKNPSETVHATIPHDSQTYKRLIKQLIDARKEIARLKAEDKVNLAQMKELMDGYNHTLELARFAARRAQPLHRQLRNLYRQNKGFQSQNMKLKAELKQFQDEVAQRNL